MKEKKLQRILNKRGTGETEMRGGVLIIGESYLKGQKEGPVKMQRKVKTKQLTSILGQL